MKTKVEEEVDHNTLQQHRRQGSDQDVISTANDPLSSQKSSSGIEGQYLSLIFIYFHAKIYTSSFVDRCMIETRLRPFIIIVVVVHSCHHQLSLHNYYLLYSPHNVSHLYFIVCQEQRCTKIPSHGLVVMPIPKTKHV